MSREKKEVKVNYSDIKPTKNQIWRCYWENNIWMPREIRWDKKRANPQSIIDYLENYHKNPWNPNDLQKDLDMIVDLFAKIGLKANNSKTKFMIVRGAKAPTALSRDQYESRINQQLRNSRRGPRIASNTKYNEWRKQKVECSVCGKVMQIVSLKRHMISQHADNSQREYKCREIDENIDGKVFHIQEFKLGMACPVPGCIGSGADKFNMYRHFNLMHPQTDIIIQEDGILSKCNLCGMRTPDISKHQNTYTCKQAQRRRNNEQR